MTRHQRGFPDSRPSGPSPDLWPPWLGRRPLGFSVSSAPSRSGTGHARHGGDKVRHRPVTASLASARPPWPAHSPRATGVAMHVDPRDALIPHLHTRPPPAAAPSDWDRRAAGQSPRPVQETDTRARSSSGGYPERSSQNLPAMRPRTVQAATVTTGGSLCEHAPSSPAPPRRYRKPPQPGTTRTRPRRRRTQFPSPTAAPRSGE